MNLANGSVLANPKEVHLGATDYFKDFLTEQPIVESPNLLSLITISITDDENDKLCREPLEEEVRDALVSIPKNSSSRPDGFGLTFYIARWDIVKDLVEAAGDFFRGMSLPKFYSSSFIVLVPKVQDPRSFDKFHPISLLSVAYKIFSRFLLRG